MRTCLRPSLLCFLLLFVFSDYSEGLFFHYPKRALMNFLESLGGHKEQKPIHHYHMHYYPVPLPVIVPKPRPPPPKIEIDLSSIHSGWVNQDFGNFHNPEITIPAPHTEASWAAPLSDPWPDSSSSVQQKSFATWDNNDLLEKDHTYKEAKSPGILLQVPLQQQIVLYQPPAKEKSSLLSTLLRKIRRINDALFHPEDDYVDHQDNKPHISNSLTYAASH